MEKRLSPIAEEVVEFFFEKVKLIKEQPSDKYANVPRELVFSHQDCLFEIPYEFDRTELFFYTHRYGQTGPLGLFLSFFERFQEKDDYILISKKKLKQPFFSFSWLPGQKKTSVNRTELVRISPFHFSNADQEKTTQEIWLEEIFIKRLFQTMIDLMMDSETVPLGDLKPDISICLDEYKKNSFKEKEADLEIPFRFNEEEVIAAFIRTDDKFILDKLYDSSSSLRKANYSFYAFERLFNQKAIENNFHFLTLQLPVIQRKELFRLYGEVLKHALKLVVDEEARSKARKFAPLTTFPTKSLKILSTK